MPPTKVRPKKFPCFKVLYNYNGFAIAWGIYNKETPERLAMRWNGGPNEVGYPCQGKYPVWFMLPEQLSVPLVSALRDIKSAKSQLILKVLKQLQPTAQKR
jgi:hypothetical protein